MGTHPRFHYITAIHDRVIMSYTFGQMSMEVKERGLK